MNDNIISKPEIQPPAKKGSWLATLIVLAIAVGYSVLPVDLVPDFLPFGTVDEVVMTILMFWINQRFGKKV